MFNLVKDSVNDVLRTVGYRVVSAPKDKACGFNFSEDIRKLVVDEAPICFDIGANKGQTINLFKKAFKSPVIHSFEPSKDSFEALKSNDYGSQVSLYNFAMGSQNIDQEFINYEDPLLSSFLPLDQNLKNDFRTTKVKNTELVSVKTIDWFVSQNGISKIDMLKIDTQGYDFEVLKGATKTLESGSINHIFVELNFIKMYKNQGSAYLIAEFLAEHNMHLVDYYEKVRPSCTLGWCTALFKKG
jgi:FkbM family methyltransferase